MWSIYHYIGWIIAGFFFSYAIPVPTGYYIPEPCSSFILPTGKLVYLWAF